MQLSLNKFNIINLTYTFNCALTCNSLPMILSAVSLRRSVRNSNRTVCCWKLLKGKFIISQSKSQFLSWL